MLDQECRASLLQPLLLFPVHIEWKQELDKFYSTLFTYVMMLPHFVQIRPSRQEVDAMFSLCALPTVF